jgi:hypothetical protein
MHQCGFAAAGNTGDHRKSSNRKADIEIFQIIGAGAMDLDPVFDIAQ